MRIEKGEGWELRNSDCLDPDTGLYSLESVDSVITDPPYSERVHSGARSSSTSTAYETGPSAAGPATRRRVDLGFGHLRDDVRKGVALEVGRIVQRWALAFSDVESVHLWMAEFGNAGLSHSVVGLWRRTNGAPRFHGRSPAPSVEAIEISYRKQGWNGGGKHAFWAYPIVIDRGGRNERRVHTTQKPLPLMEALVRDFTNAGDLICDPFAGAGTTGVAAIRLGRRFIGWEIDEPTFDIACARLRKTRTQGDLFERTLGLVSQDRLEGID